GAETIYLQIMLESVGSYVDIQFDKTEKTYVMTPTDQGLIDEISMLPLSIGHEEWGTLVDGMASMSKSGKDLVGEGYTSNLVNPVNHENISCMIMGGEVIYNVIDDLEEAGEKSSVFFFTYDKSMYIMNIYYKGNGGILMSYIRKTFNIPGDIVSAIE